MYGIVQVTKIKQSEGGNRRSEQSKIMLYYNRNDPRTDIKPRSLFTIKIPPHLAYNVHKGGLKISTNHQST